MNQLSENFAQQVGTMPESSMGVTRVCVTLADGMIIPGVLIAWCQIVYASDIQFNADDIVSIIHDP